MYIALLRRAAPPSLAEVVCSPARGAQALVAASFQDSLGDSGDMRARSSGCDDHHVGERRAPCKFDADDILGLGVVQATEHRLHEHTL